MGVPLGEKFNGEFGTLTPNFSPRKNFRETILGAFDAEATAVLEFRKLGTWAFKFGEKKYFVKNFFRDENWRSKSGGNLQGKRPARISPF